MPLLDWCMKNPFYTSLALFSTVEERSVPFLKGFLTLNCSKCTRGVVHHTGKARGELLMSESPLRLLLHWRHPSGHQPRSHIGPWAVWNHGARAKPKAAWQELSTPEALRVGGSHRFRASGRGLCKKTSSEKNTREIWWSFPQSIFILFFKPRGCYWVGSWSGPIKRAALFNT